MRRLLFAALLLGLAGCSSLALRGGDVGAEVDRLVAEQEYGKALDAFSYAREEDPNYKALMQKRAKVEALAQTYEKESLKRGETLTAKGQWVEALNTYRDAIRRLPRSQALREGLQTYRSKQAERIKALRLEQLIAEARWLQQDLPIQESITRVDPDAWMENERLKHQREKATELATALTEVGVAALEAEDLNLAGRTLPLAARLDPSIAGDAKEQLSLAEAQQTRAKEVRREKAMERLRQKETSRLLTLFDQAFAKDDLVQARDLILRLSEMEENNSEVDRRRVALEKHLSRVVGKELDDGMKFYSRGQFEEAVACWRRVLTLEPEHEVARNSLERAERVVEKLRQLREKQETRNN